MLQAIVEKRNTWIYYMSMHSTNHGIFFKSIFFKENYYICFREINSIFGLSSETTLHYKLIKDFFFFFLFMVDIKFDEDIVNEKPRLSQI